MTSTLDPSHKQIEMWRRATGSEGGLDEYRNWVLENSMRFTAYGIHTVIVFCVAFVRNNTVMQKTGHLTGGRREESK